MKGTLSQNYQFWFRNGLKLQVVFESLQTILLCIAGELAGGGSVPVAVGASGM